MSEFPKPLYGSSWAQKAVNAYDDDADQSAIFFVLMAIAAELHQFNDKLQDLGMTLADIRDGVVRM